MNITKFVFKTHKWLAVSAGAMTVLWFFSGIFMTIPGPLLRAFAQDEKPPAETASPYRNLRVSVPGAIAAADGAAGRNVDVHDIAFRKIEDRLYYRVGTRQGVFLVSGDDATILRVTEDVAKRIVVHRGAGADELGSVTRLETYGVEYTFGPLPAWRIAASDAQRRIYYVEVNGGEVRFTTRVARLRGHIVGVHSLEFLNGWLSRGVIHLIMWVLAIVGTAMSVFGCWILWLQWRNWRQARGHA